jgi:toxin ParE1/3/4
MKPAVFHDQAKAELEADVAWYERCRPGLGGQFRSAVEEAVERIRENPQIGSRYGRTRFRYILVRRFPYVVFYSESAQLIRVMAVAHGRRQPGYWRRRSSR